MSAFGRPNLGQLYALLRQELQFPHESRPRDAERLRSFRVVAVTVPDDAIDMSRFEMFKGKVFLCVNLITLRGGADSRWFSEKF